MSGTLDMLDAVVARLAARIPRVAVVFFPEAPAQYRLEHPVGALLVRYGGSQYAGASAARSAMVQGRDVAVSVAAVMRRADGADGAFALIDEARAALLGLRMPGTTDGLRAVQDQFLGQAGGLWLCAIDFAAPAPVVEDRDDDDGPLLRRVTRLGPLERTETSLHPDGTITEEDHPL